MKIISFFIFFSLTVCIKSHSQNIDEALQTLTDKFPKEKIHIHFDKSLYSNGETVWYKAYILSGIELSDLSKSFYIDWYSDKGEILKHTVSPVYYSSAKGDFSIPENYEGKFIHVKAYTRWMKNFDSAYYYEKDLMVEPFNIPNEPKNPKSKQVRPSIPKIDPLPKIISKASLEFFPEGGELLTNVNSKVAFIIRNQFGTPVSGLGCIKNNKNEFIDSFQSQHDGMGFFYFQPEANQTYTAFWKDQFEIEHETILPKAFESGAAMEVQSQKNKVLFLIRKGKVVPESFSNMFVVATINEHQVYRSKINFTQRNEIFGEIKTENLPTGILTITLLDNNFDPVAERICFINNQEFLFSPSIKAFGLKLNKKSKNTLEVLVDDTLSSNMSLSIVDENIPVDSSENIYSDFFLKSEIKGKIINPAFYFQNDSDSLRNYLDLVMLTHGWRKIAWKEIVQNNYPKLIFLKEEKYIGLEGKIYGIDFKKHNDANKLLLILQNKDTIKSSNSRTNLFLDIDQNGEFNSKIKDLFFFDTLYAYYQIAGNKNLNNRMELTFNTGLIETFSNKLAMSTPSFIYQNLFDSSEIIRRRQFLKDLNEKNLKEQHLLDEVIVSTKTKNPFEKIDEKYAKGLFSGGDSKQFDVTNDPLANGALDVFSYLQGRVAGLNIVNSGADVSLTWRGSEPALYLDEFQTDAQQIKNIPMADIAYVKAFPPPFFGTTGSSSGGAIAIYTRKGGDFKPTPGSGLSYKILVGYTPYREFYAPEVLSEDDLTKKDLRTTLYWNPFIITTNKNRNFNVIFHNNDFTKKIKIVLEGVNSEGKMAHIEKILY